MHDDLSATLCSLAPLDVRDVPIYIAMTSDGIPEGVLPRCAFGTFGRMLDIHLREWLTSRGEWHGRGFAIVIDDDKLRATVSPQFHDQAILATAIHELGHALDVDAIDLAEPADAKVCCAALTVSAAMWDQMLLKESSSAADLASRVPAWFTHEAEWIRATAHLAWRAKRQGLPIGLFCLADFARYELSSADDYAAALEPEFQPSGNCSLIELRKQQPPAAFVDLWRSDIKAWYSKQPTDTARDLCAFNLSLFQRNPAMYDPARRSFPGDPEWQQAWTRYEDAEWLCDLFALKIVDGQDVDAKKIALVLDVLNITPEEFEEHINATRYAVERGLVEELPERRLSRMFEEARAALA
jgi:hypothetical protein